MRPVSPPLPFLRLPARPALVALGLAVLAPLPAAAQAQDTSRIARVTVYPGSATVERVAKVAAGARSLTLACLPASLDVQSLQINADRLVVMDRGSTNGSYVVRRGMSKALTAGRPSTLLPGDEVRFGDRTMTVERDA